MDKNKIGIGEGKMLSGNYQNLEHLPPNVKQLETYGYVTKLKIF